MFETEIGSYMQSQKSKIDVSCRIRRICLKLSDKKSGRKIWGIRFIDDKGRKIMTHTWNKTGKWVA